MAAIWDSSKAIEGGFKGIKKIRAKLSNVEDDIEGQYGTQIRLTFKDVEVLESEEPVVVRDGYLQTYVKQSNRANSVNMKMLRDWELFARQYGLTIPNGLLNKDLVWENKTYPFQGEGMSPGKAYVPIAFSSLPSTDVPSVPPPPDEELVGLIRHLVGDDGATRDIIRRELIKKASLREKLESMGGLERVINFMTENNLLVVSDGVLMVPPVHINSAVNSGFPQG